MCGIWWLSQEAKTLFKALVSQIGSQNKTKKYWKAREKSLCAEKNYHCLLGWNRLQDIKMRSHVEKHISECWAVFQLRNGKHPSLQSHESESKKKIIIMAQRQLISVRVIVLLVHKTLGFIASGYANRKPHWLFIYENEESCALELSFEKNKPVIARNWEHCGGARPGWTPMLYCILLCSARRKGASPCQRGPSQSPAWGTTGAVSRVQSLPAFQFPCSTISSC